MSTLLMEGRHQRATQMSTFLMEGWHHCATQMSTLLMEGRHQRATQMSTFLMEGWHHCATHMSTLLMEGRHQRATQMSTFLMEGWHHCATQMSTFLMEGWHHCATQMSTLLMKELRSVYAAYILSCCWHLALSVHLVESSSLCVTMVNVPIVCLFQWLYTVKLSMRLQYNCLGQPMVLNLTLWNSVLLVWLTHERWLRK